MQACNRLRWLTVLLSAALLVLLGSGTTLAYEVQYEGSNATGILGLVVDGASYDVTFQSDTASILYGQPPGSFLLDEQQAGAAVDAVNDALNSVGQIQTVGPGSAAEYFIGYDFENSLVFVRQAIYEGGDWGRVTGVLFHQKADEHSYAVFDFRVPVESGSWGKIKALYR